MKRGPPKQDPDSTGQSRIYGEHLDQLKTTLRRELNLPQNKTILLFVGRLNLQKRPQALLRLASFLVGRKKADFLVLVVGSGAEQQEFQQSMKSLNLTEVFQFSGRVKKDDTTKYLLASDIFLLTSINEGLSLATAEAMAQGLVPVVSNVGQQYELIHHEKNGFLVNVTTLESISPDEVQRWGHILTLLLGNTTLRDQLGSQAMQSVCQPSSTTFVETVSELYQRNLNKTEGNPKEEKLGLALRIAQLGADYIRNNVRWMN